jgi:hypothetical protein
MTADSVGAKDAALDSTSVPVRRQDLLRWRHLMASMYGEPKEERVTVGRSGWIWLRL